MYRWVIGVSLAAIVLLPERPAHADEGKPVTDLFLARYELGRRLKTFEAEWEKITDPTARTRAITRLAEVHPQFLSLQFSAAGRTLDRTIAALANEATPGRNEEWVASLCAAPESRFVDGAMRELTVTIRPLYPLTSAVPKNLEIQLWFSDKQVITAKPEAFPLIMKVPLPPLGEFRGLDRKLYFMAEAGRSVRRVPIGVSQADKLADRIAALKAAADGWPALDTIEKATVRDRITLLTELADGAVPETDAPAAELLANAERMLDGKPFYTAERSGQFWMSVPLGGRKTAPTRVFVPKGLDPKKPVPVVVGLHGAGGSENVFFEAYGAGRAIAECEQRGWIFVATRSGLDFTSSPPVPAILDQLATRYPLDPKRVFLIGHSMGAAQVIRLAQNSPGRFAGVAAIAGGGSVTVPKAMAELPLFVSAGEKDFALMGARGLNKALATAGAKRLTYKEYPSVEHLVIVREALPEIFAGFEKVAAN